MNFIGTLFRDMERSSAGSEDTARRVMAMCGDISPERALFVGDDCFTPLLIRETGCALISAFTEDFRAEQAAEKGLDSRVVQLFELPRDEKGFDLIWYNGTVEFDGTAQRLEALRARSSGVVVYRALSWLIEPMPDTRAYYERRFGIIEQTYTVISAAKERGFKVKDLYIAPKSDWRENYYKPLNAAAKRYEELHPDVELAAGIRELDRETDMFEGHGEEFSYIYYVLEAV